MPSPQRRLRALLSHLAPPNAADAGSCKSVADSAGAAAEGRQPWEWAPGAEPRLLDDAAMQQFVVDGFLVLPLKEDFPPSFHRKLHADALDIFERSGRVGGPVGWTPSAAEGAVRRYLLLSSCSFSCRSLKLASY